MHGVLVWNGQVADAAKRCDSPEGRHAPPAAIPAEHASLAGVQAEPRSAADGPDALTRNQSADRLRTFRDDVPALCPGPRAHRR